MAATAAGKDFGAAKDAQVFALRVLDCEGYADVCRPFLDGMITARYFDGAGFN